MRTMLIPWTLAAFLLTEASAQERRQTQADDYTRYELLEPGSQSFRIIYDVTATTSGADYYYNTLRAGSEHSIHGVYDLMTGGELEWSVVGGEVAKKGGVADAEPEGEYLAVKLARPVPAGGEGRIRIDKTYKDPKSYYREGDRIVFSRSLGIRRNAVVLPKGYELVRCNYPSQIMTEPDGRIKVSFMNPGPSGVPYRVEARPLAISAPADREPVGQRGESETYSSPARPAAAPAGAEFSERAFQDREIVYFLDDPKTHSFRLYHDYTETREGVDRYLNIVRAGSKASNPKATILDTGQLLRVETLRGEQIASKGIDVGETSADTEVVVIWFDPVKKGHSIRLRIEETYTDPHRYLLVGGDLVWDRSFGRPRNTVILPEGWRVTQSSIPTTVDETEDGLIRLYYENDRPGDIDVFIRAKPKALQ